MNDLPDIQWCILDLLMRSRAKGVKVLNKTELLYTETIPIGLRVKLAFNALTMPAQLVHWYDSQHFEITEAGVQLYNLKFGVDGKPAKPTEAADHIIYLPGPEHYAN